jgi:uncharacterized SAM-binding protein YcdF (DUF218 family)
MTLNNCKIWRNRHRHKTVASDFVVENIALHNRLSGLPILVSGGSPLATRTSEAARMKAALNQDFRTNVKWLEEKSINTFESARNARQQL